MTSPSNSGARLQTFMAPPPPPPPELGVGVVAGGSGVVAGGGVGVELVGGVGFPATEIATLSAPIASTRPKPKVPSGATLPSWVAPFVNTSTSWDAVIAGYPERISAATAA